jgi:hypothetical protein
MNNIQKLESNYKRVPIRFIDYMFDVSRVYVSEYIGLPLMLTIRKIGDSFVFVVEADTTTHPIIFVDVSIKLYNLKIKMSKDEIFIKSKDSSIKIGLA